jgi:hypothetical protein
LWLDLIGLHVCIILAAIIFADDAICTRSSSSLFRYKERFRNLSSDFSARFSDLFAIYAQVQVCLDNYPHRSLSLLSFLL